MVPGSIWRSPVRCAIVAGPPAPESDMSLFSTPFDPSRDRALVTGAGNGIGRAIAQALVGEGVRTVFADVNADRASAAIGASRSPDLAMPWVGDLAELAACDALLAAADAALGE